MVEFMNLLIPSLDLFARILGFWEELKIIRDLSKRDEAVQQRFILVFELKMNEEKEFVYVEEATLEVEVQASHNFDMNKLDEEKI